MHHSSLEPLQVLYLLKIEKTFRFAGVFTERGNSLQKESFIAWPTSHVVDIYDKGSMVSVTFLLILKVERSFLNSLE